MTPKHTPYYLILDTRYPKPLLVGMGMSETSAWTYAVMHSVLDLSKRDSYDLDEIKLHRAKLSAYCKCIKVREVKE